MRRPRHGAARQTVAVPGSGSGTCTGVVDIVLTAVTRSTTTVTPRVRGPGRRSALPFQADRRLDRTLDVDPAFWTGRSTLQGPISTRRQRALIPDDLLDKFTFAGTPEEVAAHAAAVYDAGAARIEFDSPFGLTPASGIELLGTRVLPILRGAGYGPGGAGAR